MIIVIIRIRNRRHPRLDTQPICGDGESEVQIDGQTSEGKYIGRSVRLSLRLYVLLYETSRLLQYDLYQCH